MTAVTAVTEEERARLLADIEKGAGKLAPIELTIARNLGERPLRTWCTACAAMLRAIHKKACSPTSYPAPRSQTL